MITIGTFLASDSGFVGSIRTLMLSVKVKLVPNTKGGDNAPDFRLVTTAGQEIGAAWRKVSKSSDRPYLSVTFDDVSFPTPVVARLVEVDRGTHSLIWSRI